MVGLDWWGEDSHSVVLVGMLCCGSAAQRICHNLQLTGVGRRSDVFSPELRCVPFLCLPCRRKEM